MQASAYIRARNARSTCMWVRCHSPDEQDTTRTLLGGSFLESGHQFGGHPSAVFHLDALRLGPLTHLGGVRPAARSLASAVGWPPGAAPRPPGGTHVARQRLPQRPGMLGVQVDLVLGAVQREADGPFSLGAIQVIDEQDLYLLSYG